MNKVTENTFCEIIEEALHKADRVRCSQEDFLGGLELMLEHLQEREQAVREEIG